MGNDKKDFKFDKRASEYDENFEGKLSKKFYQLITENVELSDNCKVIDVGCGTGTILHRLNSKCAIDGYGIDVEENMLTEAKKKCPQMNILLGSCENIPFESGNFDVVIACMAFHHFPNKVGFIKEAARLLKKGGKLYIADPKFPFLVRKTLNAILSLFKVVGEFYKQEEITKMITPYGFEQVGYKSDAYAQLVVFQKK